MEHGLFSLLSNKEKRHLVQLARNGISPVDMMSEIVLNRAAGIEVFAKFLEMQGYRGLLKKLAEHFVPECRPFLEEVLPLKGEALRVLENPREFFNVDDEREVIRLTTAYFMARVNSSSPRYIIRAMIAHIEFGLENWENAINSAGFALNEKSTPYFPEVLNDPNQGVLLWSLLSEVERRKAEILSDLLKKMRMN